MNILSFFRRSLLHLIICAAGPLDGTSGGGATADNEEEDRKMSAAELRQHLQDTETNRNAASDGDELAANDQDEQATETNSHTFDGFVNWLPDSNNNGNTDETTMQMDQGGNNIFSFSQSSDMTDDHADEGFQSFSLSENFHYLGSDIPIDECVKKWFDFNGLSALVPTRREMEGQIMHHLNLAAATAERANEMIRASWSDGLDQINPEAAIQHGINNADLSNRLSEYSLLQAVADATHLTIMLFDEKSGIRMKVFTPGPDSTPLSNSAAVGVIHLSCDITARRDDGSMVDANDEMSLYSEEASIASMEAEIADQMSMGSRHDEKEGDEDDSDDGNFSSDDGSSQSSESEASMNINHCIQDITVPSRIPDKQLSAISGLHRVNIRIVDDVEGGFRITISGKPMDVEDASDCFKRNWEGKANMEHRVMTQTRGYSFNLLVHKLDPKLREGAGGWLGVEQFWYEPGRDECDDNGNFLIPRVTNPNRYHLKVHCSDKAKPVSIYISQNISFTQLEGEVALGNGQIALGLQNTVDRVTFDRSDLTLDEVYELLYKSGYFPHGRTNLPFNVERRNWLNNRTRLLPGFIRTVVQSMKQFLRRKGLPAKPPTHYNADSPHLLDIFDDNYKEGLGLKNYTRIKSIGDAGGFPTYHACHNFISQGTTYFFNPHDVENKPPNEHFWDDGTYPPGTRWFDTIGQAGQDFINNYCKGMPCITPPRMTLHTFHPDPISPHLDESQYEERAAWTHTSAIGAIQFHLFHGNNRYNYYGQVGAPYGDEVSLYQTSPHREGHTFMNMTMWMHTNMGESEFPIPIFRAFHIKFNNPMNPSLADCTITKYWDNYNYCQMEVVTLASI